MLAINKFIDTISIAAFRKLFIFCTQSIWFFRFECFRHALFFGKLLYQPREHFLCLLANVSKITVQFAAGEQRGIQRPAVVLGIVPVSLSPDANEYRFFLRQFQTGQIIVPLQLIPKPVLLIVDVLLSCDPSI
mgnify:CR=1 FL=1